MELQQQGVTREQLMRQRDSGSVSMDDTGTIRSNKQFIDVEQQLYNIIKINYDKSMRHDSIQQQLYPKLRQYQFMCIQLYGCIQCYNYLDLQQCQQCGCTWNTNQMNEIIAAYKQQNVPTEYYLQQRTGLFPFHGLSQYVKQRMRHDHIVEDDMMNASVNPTDALLLQHYPLYIQPSQTLPYLHNLVSHTHQRFYAETILGQRVTQTQLIYKQLAIEYKQHMINYANITQQNKLRLSDLQDACIDIGVDMKLVLSQTPLSMIPIEQVRQVRIMRSQAVIPDMIVDKQHALIFNNNNGCIDDLKSYEQLHKQQHVWSESEKSIFIRQYLKSPKQFKKISQHLPNKSINDCVAFYYLTKFDIKYKQLLKQKQQYRLNKTQAMLSNQPTAVNNDVMQSLSVDDILTDEQRYEAYTKIQQKQMQQQQSTNNNAMYNINQNDEQNDHTIHSASESDDEQEQQFDAINNNNNNNNNQNTDKQSSASQRIPRELMSLAVDISNMEQRRNNHKKHADTDSTDTDETESSSDDEVPVKQSTSHKPSITRGKLMNNNSSRIRQNSTNSNNNKSTQQRNKRARSQSIESKIQSGSDDDSSSTSDDADSDTNDIMSTQQRSTTVRAEWSLNEKKRMLDGLALYGKNFIKLSDYIISKDIDKCKIWYMNNRRRSNVMQQLALFEQNKK